MTGSAVSPRVETTAELVRSRARIQAAGDERLRRLQREVHDGAQQRLVHALIALKLARAGLDPGAPAAGLVEEALVNVEQASRDLRAAMVALLPHALTVHGLAGGLQALADTVAVSVRVDVRSPRLSPELETTVFAALAETVRAITSRTGCTHVVLTVRREAEVVAAEVRFDWVAPGGSEVAEGGGDMVRASLEGALQGARDRVRASGGWQTVAQSAGGGGVVRICLPIEPGDVMTV